jgi:hypothetical protein
MSRVVRKVVLGSLLGFACFASAQQQPVGDVMQSGVAGGETPAQAVQTLHKITATIIDDPSSGYDPKTTSWPEADADRQQWGNSMALHGNDLTQQQRDVLIPCAVNLETALDSAQRGYLIQTSQQGNPAAQPTVQQLKAKARSEFALCNLADALNGSNGNPATGGNNPGSEPGGTSGGGSGAPIQGGVSTGSNGTPGTSDGGTPGTPQTPGTQSGLPPGTTPQGTPPGTKGIYRDPAPATPIPGKSPTPSKSDTPTPPNVPAFEKAMSDCLNAKLPYAVPPSIDPSFLLKATDLAPDDVRVTPFNKMSAPTQIFLLETAMALQAQSIHDSQYGANPYNEQDSQNYMVGWLDRCLMSAGQIPMPNDSGPNSAPKLYAIYLGVAPLKAAVNNNQVRYFLEGYTTNPMPPPSLMPPRPPSSIPGLLPLKPNPTSGTSP